MGNFCFGRRAALRSRVNNWQGDAFFRSSLLRECIEEKGGRGSESLLRYVQVNIVSNAWEEGNSFFHTVPLFIPLRIQV